MKILVYSYCRPTDSHEGATFGRIAELTQPSVIEYCRTHGYDYYFQDSGFDSKKIIGWERYEITLKKLNDYDYIFYLDADATIMNHTIRLENIIDPDYDIQIAKNSIAKDWTGINTGVILFKCSSWTKRFLRYLIDSKTHLHTTWGFEQSAIIEAVSNNEMECIIHIKIVKNRLFNSYYHEWYQEDDFRIGDFVLHVCGTSNAFREKVFVEVKDRVIKVPDYKIPFKPFV